MLNISPAPVSSASLTLGTITRVQSTTANTGSSTVLTSLNLVFGGNLTVGNVVVAAFSLISAPMPRLADPGGNSKSYACGHFPGVTLSSLIFVDVTTAGTTCTFSMENGLAFVTGLVGAEYSGVKLRPDGMAVGNGGTSTINATGLLTTNYPNELIIAAMATRGTFAAEQTGWLTGISNSFSSVAQTSSFVNTTNTDRAIALCERIVTSAGSYSTSGTQPSAQTSNVIASFVSD